MRIQLSRSMKLIPFILFILIISSCHSEKTIPNSIREHVETYLKSNGQMSNGYQFVSITDIDTVTAQDYIQKEIDLLTLALTNKEIRLKRLDSLEILYKKAVSDHPNDKTLQGNLRDITRSKTALYTQQNKLDSLNAAIKPEMAHTFKFIGLNFTFNHQDSKGVETLTKYYVKLDENLNVVSATKLNQ